MENEQTLSVATTVAAIYDGVIWFFQNLLFAFYNIGYAALNPGPDLKLHIQYCKRQIKGFGKTK